MNDYLIGFIHGVFLVAIYDEGPLWMVALLYGTVIVVSAFANEFLRGWRKRHGW